MEGDGLQRGRERDGVYDFDRVEGIDFRSLSSAVHAEFYSTYSVCFVLFCCCFVVLLLFVCLFVLVLCASHQGMFDHSK